MKYGILGFLLLFGIACNRPAFKEKWLTKKAPEQFHLRFETSKGVFEAEFIRQWSPLAVDRLYAQISHGYYNHTLFYRIRPGYVAQFGGDDSLRMKQWRSIKVPDEPVIQPNHRGNISFARSGKETRDNDLFINLQNNSPRLDTISSGGVKGYPVLGRITKGMEVVDALYSGYGDTVFEKYRLLFSNKKAFITAYPMLDSLIQIKLIKKS